MDNKKNTGRYEYGMCGISVFNKNTGAWIGTVNDVKSAVYNETVEMNQAEVGGCARFSRDVQVGSGEASLTLSLNKKPFWWYEAFNGKSGTIVSTPEASGNVGAISNIKGTSVVSPTTGIASAAVIPTTGAANLKWTKIYVVAVSATTVDVYTDSQETPIVSGLTITASGTITVPLLGIQFTGGSGSIALTTGDQAVLETRPINNGTFSIGTTGNENIPELTVVIYGQELINKQQSRLTVYRCIGYGVNEEFTAKEYTQPEIELKVLQPTDGTNMKLYEVLDKA